MQLPSEWSGTYLARLAQGAAAGAVATIAIGFIWGGWTLNSTAVKNTEMKVNAALIDAYAPVCAERFTKQADAAKWAAFEKVSTWQRDTFVKEGGFATIPGHKSPNSAIADACANLLNKIVETRPKS